MIPRKGVNRRHNLKDRNTTANRKKSNWWLVYGV